MDTKKVQNIVFFIILGLVTLLFLYILKPFFTPIFWAAVIASIFTSLYQRLNKKLNRPNLSASLMLLLIVLIIILPAAIIGSLLISESIQIYNSISTDTSAIENKVQDVLNLLTSNTTMKKFQMDQQLIAESSPRASKVLPIISLST